MEGVTPDGEWITKVFLSLEVRAKFLARPERREN